MMPTGMIVPEQAATAYAQELVLLSGIVASFLLSETIASLAASARIKGTKTAQTQTNPQPAVAHNSWLATLWLAGQPLPSIEELLDGCFCIGEEGHFGNCE